MSLKGNVIILRRSHIQLFPTPWRLCLAWPSHALVSRSWHELDILSNHLMLTAFLAVRTLPTPPLQTPFDQHRAALAQILTHHLSLATEGDNINKTDLFLAFLALG